MAGCKLFTGPHLWRHSLKFACGINRLGISLRNHERVNNGGDRVQMKKCYSSFRLLRHMYIYRKENGLTFPRGWWVYKISNIYWNLWQQFHASDLIQQPTHGLVRFPRPRYTYITMQIGFDDIGKFLTKFYHRLLSMLEFLTISYIILTLNMINIGTTAICTGATCRNAP
jgi:hypothetical protein